MRILVVDDDTQLRNSLYELFKKHHDVILADNGKKGLDELFKTSFDLVITDHKMPEMTGIELIREGKEKYPNTTFILVTAYATIQQAIEAIKIGADDYIMKPFDISEMEHRVKRLEDIISWKYQNMLKKEESKGIDRLIGNSSNISDAKNFVGKISDVNSSVLILGSSGTGKEVLAKAIHESSSRSNKSFIAINCATLSEQLIESELFGHEKGAFTGAVAGKPGKFELANGGTIFLDEIGELPQELQTKLLRVLQEKEYCRVGGIRTFKTDARVIAATNRNLKEMVENGKFREDLYFRLNVLAFELFPLKDRLEDIPILIDYFWKQLSKEIFRKSTLSKEIIEAMTNYHFPGNIRELNNVLERLMVLGPSEGEIGIDLLPKEFLSDLSISNNNHSVSSYDFNKSLTDQLNDIEKDIINKAMKECNNNQVKASDLLKIKRATLQYKLKKT